MIKQDDIVCYEDLSTEDALSTKVIFIVEHTRVSDTSGKATVVAYTGSELTLHGKPKVTYPAEFCRKCSEKELEYYDHYLSENVKEGSTVCYCNGGRKVLFQCSGINALFIIAVVGSVYDPDGLLGKSIAFRRKYCRPPTYWDTMIYNEQKMV